MSVQLHRRLTTDDRDRMVAVARYLIDHAALIDYAAVRPCRTLPLTWSELRNRLARGEHVAMDCSEAGTAICKWADITNPNNGADTFDPNHCYSGYFYDYLSEHYTTNTDAHPGAFGVYGFGGDDHVIMCMERGENPMCFSHGSEIGPLFISLEDESQSHVGQAFTWCNVHKLRKR
jgi:hypothetical protein